MKGEHFRHEYAAACHLHHAAGEGCTDDNTHRRDGEDDTAFGGPAAHGGVEEVRRVIGNAHHEVEDSEQEQDAQNGCIHRFHTLAVITQE